MKIYRVSACSNRDYHETAESCIEEQYFARLEAANEYADKGVEQAEHYAIINADDADQDVEVDRKERKVEFTDNMWDRIIIGVYIDEIDVIE